MAVNIDNGIVRLGDLTPELRPVIEVERNGQKHTLRGYVEGKRCPVEIKAAVAQVWERYAEGRQNNAPGIGALTNRDMLFAVIDGIELSEASVAGSDDESTLEILVRLGWMSRAEDGAEGEGQGEETTSPSTTDTSSPDSTPSTVRKTGTK